MARIDRTINPTVTTQQLEIAPQLLQQNSGYPRAVVDVAYEIAAYTGPGAGNNVQIYVNYNLPRNFAYAYLGFVFGVSTFTTNSANNFEPAYHEIVNESLPGGLGYKSWIQPVENVQVQQRADPSAEEWRIFSDRPDTRTDSIIFNTKSEEPEVRAYALNLDNNTGNGSVFYRARFLQYDISQAYAFPVNFSVPVR